MWGHEEEDGSRIAGSRKWSVLMGRQLISRLNWPPPVLFFLGGFDLSCVFPPLERVVALVYFGVFTRPGSSIRSAAEVDAGLELVPRSPPLTYTRQLSHNQSLGGCSLGRHTLELHPK